MVQNEKPGESVRGLGLSVSAMISSTEVTVDFAHMPHGWVKQLYVWEEGPD